MFRKGHGVIKIIMVNTMGTINANSKLQSNKQSIHEIHWYLVCGTEYTRLSCEEARGSGEGPIENANEQGPEIFATTMVETNTTLNEC